MTYGNYWSQFIPSKPKKTTPKRNSTPRQYQKYQPKAKPKAKPAAKTWRSKYYGPVRYRPKVTKKPVQYRPKVTKKPVQYRQPEAKGPTVPPKENIFTNLTRNVNQGINRAAEWYNKFVGGAVSGLQEAGRAIQEATPQERLSAIGQFAWRNNPQHKNPYSDPTFRPATPRPAWADELVAGIWGDEYRQRQGAGIPLNRANQAYARRALGPYQNFWYPGMDLPKSWQAYADRLTGEAVDYYSKPPTSMPPLDTGGLGGGGGGDGGYGDYGGYGGGYGGGGGGGGPADADEFYNLLTNWRILQVQGG